MPQPIEGTNGTVSWHREKGSHAGAGMGNKDIKLLMDNTFRIPGPKENICLNKGGVDLNKSPNQSVTYIWPSLNIEKIVCIFTWDPLMWLRSNYFEFGFFNKGRN